MDCFCWTNSDGCSGLRCALVSGITIDESTTSSKTLKKSYEGVAVFTLHTQSCSLLPLQRSNSIGFDRTSQVSNYPCDSVMYQINTLPYLRALSLISACCSSGHYFYLLLYLFSFVIVTALKLSNVSKGLKKSVNSTNVLVQKYIRRNDSYLSNPCNSDLSVRTKLRRSSFHSTPM